MRKRKLTILVDIDDTIEDLLGAWCDWLNTVYGTNFDKNSVTEWDLTKKFAPLKKEQIFEPLRLETFWDTVMPKPGAQDALVKLMEDGHDVYLVTATHYSTIIVKTEHMLRRCFWFVDWDHVIITSNKRLIHGDVLIDDGVHNFGSQTGILVDAPHNRGVDAAELGAVRLDNWEDIYLYVSELASMPPENDFKIVAETLDHLSHDIYHMIEAQKENLERFYTEREDATWRSSGSGAIYTPVSTK